MRALVTLTILSLCALPAFGAGKTKSDKASVCSSLVEKRLELTREILAIETRVADKKTAIEALAAKDAKDVPVVDMTAEAEVIDLTAPDEKTVTHQATLAKIQTLQSEIETLDESRLDVERFAAKVKSTLAQSCPK